MLNKLKRILSLTLVLLFVFGLMTGCQELQNTVIGDYGTQPPITSENVQNNKQELEKVPATIVTDIELLAKNYTGSAYVAVNKNVPYFNDDEKKITEPFEIYSELDELGRVGVAYANICKALMPTEDRESLSSVTPTGWHNKKYDFVDASWVYNRAHIIGFQLAGEQANEKNLMTGTRYFNVQGMLPFENMVADYVRETNHHVLYRVTPIFTGNNLLAEGVLMEAWSVEDNGDGICFNVFCYNVEPGVEFDYATGENWASGTTPITTTPNKNNEEENITKTYILNTKSKKIHTEDCSSVANMSSNNKEVYTGSKSDLIEKGYTACGICKP